MNDLAVILSMRRGRHTLDQLRNVSRSADGFKLTAGLEPLSKQHVIDAFTRIVHVKNLTIDLLIGLVIEVVRPDGQSDFVNRPRVREECCPEQPVRLPDCVAAGGLEVRR